MNDTDFPSWQSICPTNSQQSGEFLWVLYLSTLNNYFLSGSSFNLSIYSRLIASHFNLRICVWDRGWLSGRCEDAIRIKHCGLGWKTTSAGKFHNEPEVSILILYTYRYNENVWMKISLFHQIHISKLATLLTNMTLSTKMKDEKYVSIKLEKVGMCVKQSSSMCTTHL